MITFIAVFRFGLSSTRTTMAFRRVYSDGDDSQCEAEGTWRRKGDVFAVFTFLMAHSIRTKAENHNLQQGNFWVAKRIFFFFYLLSVVLWGYLDTGKRTQRIVKSSALEIFKLNRTGPWRTCSKWPCFKQGFGLDSLQGSLSTQDILQFYE